MGGRWGLGLCGIRLGETMTAPNKEKETALTAEKLRHYFSYDSDTGVFTRRRLPNKAYLSEGSIAGNLDETTGYIRITIGRRSYRAHRLAWLYVHGRWPAAFIDHVNGDRSDNRLVNLREATTSQNTGREALRKGAKGSYRQPNGRWFSTITFENKCFHLGTYATAEEAAAAYVAKARELRGQFAE